MLRYFNEYKNQYLMVAGGMGNQPAFYVWAMRILGNEDALIEKEKRDRKGKHRPLIGSHT